MDAIRLEHGFLYYYENRAGYLKNELCYVDPIFFTRELRHIGYRRHRKTVNSLRHCGWVL